MRKQYDESLNEFVDNLTQLGNMANESLYKAMKAYHDNDRELAHEVVNDDLRTNAKQADIEQEAYRLIALQQPVASDLRLIFAVLLASSDIERIADHTVNIARVVLRRKKAYTPDEKIDNIIDRMANLAQEMIGDSIQALIDRDTDAAVGVSKRDDEMDELLDELFKVASKRMTKDSDVVPSGIGYIQAGSSLERIGDYVTNICERVVFLTTAESVDL